MTRGERQTLGRAVFAAGCSGAWRPSHAAAFSGQWARLIAFPWRPGA